MNMKRYPPGKRKVLVEGGFDNFTTFLEEIRGKSAQSLQRMLLPSKGFEKKKKPKKETLRFIFKQFISKLCREKEISNPHSEVWRQFERIFVLWVESEPELFDILKGFKNKADFGANNQRTDALNSELDRQCFEHLLKASRDNRIDQETIQRFYEYGYFNKDEQIEAIIAKALPRKEIEFRLRLKALPGQVDALSETVGLLTSRFSAQELNQRITEVCADFVAQLQALSQRVAAVEPFGARLSEIESTVPRINGLRKRIKSLEFAVANVKKSVNSPNQTKPSASAFVKLKRKIGECSRQAQQLQEEIQFLVSRFDAMESPQITDAPRIAYQALQISKRYAANLEGEAPGRYQEEQEYLLAWKERLEYFCITDVADSAAALHVAVKAFPALEIADTRIIKAWQSASGNKVHVTTVDVEMGWLELHDWFPECFSEECFGEQLRLMDLTVSIEEMLRAGNLMWAIHLRNCDRSYPESYLPRFFRWLCPHKNFARVFLTRCGGPNRCDTSFEVYTNVARLPEPDKPEPLKPKSLAASEHTVAHSTWLRWCQQPPASLYHTQIQFLETLRSTIEEIPVKILQDIRLYLLLSHRILEPTKALDWGLTLRLFPWLEDRGEIVGVLLKLITEENLELRQTKAALRGGL